MRMLGVGVLYEEEEEGEGFPGGLTLLAMALAGRRFDGEGERVCPVRMVLCLLGNGADRTGLLEGMGRWYRCGAHGNACATEVFRWLVRAEPRAAAEEDYSGDEGHPSDEGSDDEDSGFDADSEGCSDDESDSLAGSDFDGPSMAFCPWRAADFPSPT
jgi:hypothetical protein